MEYQVGEAAERPLTPLPNRALPCFPLFYGATGVLRSDRAAQVNVAIIRTFVKLREILATHEGLARKVAQHDR